MARNCTFICRQRWRHAFFSLTHLVASLAVVQSAYLVVLFVAIRCLQLWPTSPSAPPPHRCRLFTPQPRHVASWAPFYLFPPPPRHVSLMCTFLFVPPDVRLIVLSPVGDRPPDALDVAVLPVHVPWQTRAGATFRYSTRAPTRTTYRSTGRRGLSWRSRHGVSFIFPVVNSNVQIGWKSSALFCKSRQFFSRMHRVFLLGFINVSLTRFRRALTNLRIPPFFVSKLQQRPSNWT